MHIPLNAPSSGSANVGCRESWRYQQDESGRALMQPHMKTSHLSLHDREHADHFYLTHKFLTAMLGVHRSGVSVAAEAFQFQKLVRHCRGELSIPNRDGLRQRLVSAITRLSKTTQVRSLRYTSTVAGGAVAIGLLVS